MIYIYIVFAIFEIILFAFQIKEVKYILDSSTIGYAKLVRHEKVQTEVGYNRKVLQNASSDFKDVDVIDLFISRKKRYGSEKVYLLKRSGKKVSITTKSLNRVIIISIIPKLLIVSFYASLLNANSSDINFMAILIPFIGDIAIYVIFLKVFRFNDTHSTNKYNMWN